MYRYKDDVIVVDPNSFYYGQKGTVIEEKVRPWGTTYNVVISGVVEPFRYVWFREEQLEANAS